MKKLIQALLFTLLLSYPLFAQALDLQFGWDPYADKAEITAFKLKIGTAPGGPYSVATITIPNPDAVSYTITAFETTYPLRKYYFVLTAFDATDGMESPNSNEVMYRKGLTQVINFIKKW
jgi:hypothetical protein